jgi:hypothetical protein
MQVTSARATRQPHRHARRRAAHSTRLRLLPVVVAHHQDRDVVVLRRERPRHLPLGGDRCYTQNSTVWIIRACVHVSFGKHVCRSEQPQNDTRRPERAHQSSTCPRAAPWNAGRVCASVCLVRMRQPGWVNERGAADADGGGRSRSGDLLVFSEVKGHIMLGLSIYRHLHARARLCTLTRTKSYRRWGAARAQGESLCLFVLSVCRGAR